MSATSSSTKNTPNIRLEKGFGSSRTPVPGTLPQHRNHSSSSRKSSPFPTGLQVTVHHSPASPTTLAIPSPTTFPTEEKLVGQSSEVIRTLYRKSRTPNDSGSKQMEEVVHLLKELGLDLRQFRKDVNVRFTELDNRVSKVEQRLGKVEDRIGKVEDRISKVEDRISKVEVAQKRTSMELANLSARSANHYPGRLTPLLNHLGEVHSQFPTTREELLVLPVATVKDMAKFYALPDAPEPQLRLSLCHFFGVIL